MDVVGIDACGRHGWVAIRLAHGGYAGSMVDARLASLLARCGDAAVIAIDMPLGLVESGWRQADTRARALLPARRSSVFMTAPRPVWDEPDYAAACRRCLALTGKQVSRQTWALAAKLREARSCWQKDPERVREVHPELSFQAMSGGRTAAHGKKSWRGQTIRRSALAAAGIALPDALGEADCVPPDDVLDAAAAAWSAHRIASGEARCLPETAERDAAGRLVAIWY